MMTIQPRSVANATPPVLGLRRENPLLGISLIVTSTLFFSLSDVLAKHLTGILPPVEVLWFRYLAFALIAFPAALFASGGRNPLFTERVGVHLLRGLTMVGSATLFIFGLRYLPLAEATAITFVAPIFVTALSIPLLGEKVGIRRWAATLIGLVGVLIVIRPGSSSFQAAAILPITAAALWACTMIATRKMSASERPQTTLAWSAVVGFVFLTALAPFQWVIPSLHDAALGLLIGLAATAGQWLMIIGYANANASVLAPFFYAQLIWASGFGFLVFGAIPGPWTYVGAAMIAASSLYIAHRERVMSRVSSG